MSKSTQIFYVWFPADLINIDIGIVLILTPYCCWLTQARHHSVSIGGCVVCAVPLALVPISTVSWSERTRIRYLDWFPHLLHFIFIMLWQILLKRIVCVDQDYTSLHVNTNFLPVLYKRKRTNSDLLLRYSWSVSSLIAQVFEHLQNPPHFLLWSYKILIVWSSSSCSKFMLFYLCKWHLLLRNL